MGRVVILKLANERTTVTAVTELTAFTIREISD